MKLKLSIIYLPISIFILNSCGTDSGKDAQGKSGKGETPAVEGYIAKTENIRDRIEVSGELLPNEETEIMPEISGRIISLHLPEGAFVTKGTLLVKLFDADLQAQLTKLKAQLNTATLTAKRQKELLDVNGISQNEYDQSVTLVDAYNADIAEIIAKISKTEIRAPYDGIIGLKKISEGAFVNVGTSLATIRSEKQLKLDFSIPESYASSIDKNSEIQFTIPGDSTIYSAAIIATEQNISEDSRNLNIRALVNSKDKKLIPGSSAIVKLAFHIHENAITVPTESIIPQARFKSVIINKNGKAVFVKVETGIRLASVIEIISGVSPGDTIVTTGIQFIRPGSKLKFSSVK